MNYYITASLYIILEVSKLIGTILAKHILSFNAAFVLSST